MAMKRENFAGNLNHEILLLFCTTTIFFYILLMILFKNSYKFKIKITLCFFYQQAWPANLTEKEFMLFFGRML